MRYIIDWIFIMFYGPLMAMGGLWPLFLIWAVIIFGLGFWVGRL